MTTLPNITHLTFMNMFTHIMYTCTTLQNFFLELQSLVLGKGVLKLEQIHTKEGSLYLAFPITKIDIFPTLSHKWALILPTEKNLSQQKAHKTSLSNNRYRIVSLILNLVYWQYLFAKFSWQVEQSVGPVLMPHVYWVPVLVFLAVCF